MRFFILLCVCTSLLAAGQESDPTHSRVRGHQDLLRGERKLKSGKKGSSDKSGKKGSSDSSSSYKGKKASRDSSSKGKKGSGGGSSKGKKGSAKGDVDAEVSFLVSVIARYDEIDGNDYNLLEDEFQDSYNDLTSARYIEDTQIRRPVPLDFADFNITRTNNNSVTSAQTLIYDVDAHCNRDCRGEIELTRSGFSGAFNAISNPPAATRNRRRKGGNSGKNKDGKRSSGIPTEMEVQRSYNEEIQELIQDRRLDAVDAITHVAELRRVDCRGDLNSLVTTVDITFVGDTLLLPGLDQLQVLSQVFQRTYYDLSLLNAQSCDTVFRTLTEVTTGNQNRRKLQTMVEEFTARFTLQYVCIGCPYGTPLFDTASSARRLPEENVLENARHRYMRSGKKSARGDDDDDDGYRYRNSGKKSVRGDDDDDDDYGYRKSGKKSSSGKKGYRDGDDDDDDDDDDDNYNRPNTSPTSSAIECVCPINARDFRAPTTAEFLPAFDNNLRILTQQGAIDYINQVILVEEIGPASLAPSSSPTDQTGGTPDIDLSAAAEINAISRSSNTSHGGLDFATVDLKLFEAEETDRRPPRNHRLN